MATTMERGSGTLDTTKHLIVFSADAHMGPLFEDMRQYCPKALLDDFDEGLKAQKAMAEMMAANGGGFFGGDSPRGKQLAAAMACNATTTGHHDIHAYLHDMDTDGIAAEVFFHGSQNNEGIPFVGPLGFTPDHSESPELPKRATGMHMYNQWLADAVAVAPDRLFPAMILPMWDIDASVKELEWGLANGLRVVNFQAPRRGVIGYDNPAWEPFWAAAEEGGALLSTHAGALDMDLFSPDAGPHAFTLIELESGGWMARRAISRLIFGGVFNNHPNLKYCVAEQNGEWWSATIREYDSSYVNHRHLYAEQVPEPPSYYLKQNVFIGASFMAPFEAKMAVEEGYWENVMWGRDYPHIEGTWVAQDEADALSDKNLTHQSLRYTFDGIPGEAVAGMLGGNAVQWLGLDEAALQKVADTIHAPTLEEIQRPLDEIPEDGGILAFRTIGAWW